jgi:hypothetical protein
MVDGEGQELLKNLFAVNESPEKLPAAPERSYPC